MKKWFFTTPGLFFKFEREVGADGSESWAVEFQGERMSGFASSSAAYAWLSKRVKR